MKRTRTKATGTSPELMKSLDILMRPRPASDDDGCPKGDPECLSGNGDCHDECSTFAERQIASALRWIEQHGNLVDYPCPEGAVPGIFGAMSRERLIHVRHGRLALTAKGKDFMERKEATPEHTASAEAELPGDPCAWMIVYEDTDQPMELFTGAGATIAAHRRFEDMRKAWTCHLFVRVAKG